jgi:hypothetical protein
MMKRAIKKRMDGKKELTAENEQTAIRANESGMHENGSIGFASIFATMENVCKDPGQSLLPEANSGEDQTHKQLLNIGHRG